MPAIRHIPAAAVTLAALLGSHSAPAAAAPTTSAPGSPEPTPTGFYWPWQNWTQPWATVIAGGAVLIAALITLIIAWLTRRQTDRHWTATNRQQRFIEAARQLADPNPAVRIAGVAAMETLTDDWLTSNLVRRLLRLPARRARHLQAQQCVNVLTAYLRIPATPPPDDDPTIREEHITTTRGRGSARDRGNTVERHHHYTVNDDEVRATITRTIAAHLRKDPVGRTWSTLTYDFTGAHFHNADFYNAVWIHPPNFTDAVFTGITQFSLARIGNNALFVRATFCSVSFIDATFGDEVWFAKARFGDRARFVSATFGDQTNFGGASFGDQASFIAATFGDRARFDGARFGDNADFRAKFGDNAIFRGARFGDNASFDHGTFGDNAWFFRAAFGDQASFIGASFGDQASFIGARFGDKTEFGPRFGDTAEIAKIGNVAKLAAGFGDQANFMGATFGDQASFIGATFGAGARFDEGTFDEETFGQARFGDDPTFDEATFGANPPRRPNTVTPDNWPLPGDNPPATETD